LALLVFLPLTHPTLAQNEQVAGTVVDQTGMPVIGASVRLENSQSIGTITDMDGHFRLSGLPAKGSLTVSYIGYQTQRVAYQAGRTLQVTLQEDSKALDEVVVVGYGTQKKANLTGAVAQTDDKFLQSRPVASIGTALEGVMPGVNIQPTSGNPNSDISINVRGITSVNGGSPLVLVDGVESSLKLLNPNDIATISVLKDAASAAVYGVKGAFGVVLVTTKNGQAGKKLTVNYNGNYAWAAPTVMPEWVKNSYDHVTFVNQGMVNSGSADYSVFSKEVVDGIKAKLDNPSLPNYIFDSNGQYQPVGYTNWQDYLVRDWTPRQTHNFSVTGGSETTNFYASVSYQHQEGMESINPDKYNRWNSMLKVENKSLKWATLNLKAAYNTSTYDEPTKYKETFWHALIFSQPTKGGQWLGDPAHPELDGFIGDWFYDQNQEYLLRYGGRKVSRQHEIVLTPAVDITPLKGWRIHVDYNYRRVFSRDTTNKKRLDNAIKGNKGTGLILAPTGDWGADSYSLAQSERDYYSFNAYTTYERRIADAHFLKGQVGFNQELTQYTYYTASVQNLINPDKPSLSLASGTTSVTQPNNNNYEEALRGAFFHVEYNYKERYLAEVNGRYDLSSRFPRGNRSVFAPSASVGWRLSEEPFMKFARGVVDNLKLRANYGVLGNQLISGLGYYPSYEILNNGVTTPYYPFGGSSTNTYIQAPSRMLTANLTWEKVATINGGFDLTLFRQRLDLSLDVYRRNTTDMLVQRKDLPGLIGTGSPYTNGGSLKTVGWELNVGWQDRVGKDFSYGVKFNLADAQSTITKWYGNPNTVKAGADDGSTYYVGKKVGEIWGYVTDGFISTQEDLDWANGKGQSYIANGGWKMGDIKYKDLDGSGDINKGASKLDDHGDMKVIGNTTPRFMYGIAANAEYKGVYLNVFFQGIGKRNFWPSAQDFWPLATQYYVTQQRFLTDTWNPQLTAEENLAHNPYFPLTRRGNSSGGARNEQAQTKYMQDASFLRLKTLTVGYNLPESWIRKVYLTKAQIYLSGENLWTLSHLHAPIDPQTAGSSDTTWNKQAQTGALGYPYQKVISLGVNVTF
jgi:TonB-linked SusC/RagA family outer membrane protein